MKRTRWRFTRSTQGRGGWAFGFVRSLWGMPRPKGMALYAFHFLWWNLVIERDL